MQVAARMVMMKTMVMMILSYAERCCCCFWVSDSVCDVSLLIQQQPNTDDAKSDVCSNLDSTIFYYLTVIVQ